MSSNEVQQPNLFELKKPMDLAVRELTVDDVHTLYLFDILAEYEGNLDTPPDHRPEPVPEEGYKRGN